MWLNHHIQELGSMYGRCAGDLSCARRRAFPALLGARIRILQAPWGQSRTFFGRVTCFASPRLPCASVCVGGWVEEETGHRKIIQAAGKTIPATDDEGLD